jgi:hypothetical protein
MRPIVITTDDGTNYAAMTSTDEGAYLAYDEVIAVVKKFDLEEKTDAVAA